MAFTTKKSLLMRVREGDEVSWNDFYTAYKPLIFLCGGDFGLTPDEKEELVQQVMTDIFKRDILGKYDLDHVPDDVVFKYDPAKGRFRHYLRKIVQNHAVRIYRGRKRHEAENIDDMPEIAGNDEWNSMWDSEWKKHVLTMALTELKIRIRPETYVAFEMYALQNRSVEDTASFLNMSIASVYTAKSRCIAALKDIIADMEEK